VLFSKGPHIADGEKEYDSLGNPVLKGVRDENGNVAPFWVENVRVIFG